LKKGVEAMHILTTNDDILPAEKARQLRRLEKAIAIAPSIEERDLQDKVKCQKWARKCRAIIKRTVRAMKRIAHTERKERIKKLIARLQEEGGRRSRKFYSKIRNAIWGTRNHSVKIGIKKGINGERITISEPEEVKEYIRKAWQSHFAPQPTQEGTQPEEWIGTANKITGNTDSLVTKIKTEELTETIKNISNGKAPGPTGETIEMIKWLDETNLRLVKTLFNTIMKTGYLPDSWKTAKIFGIYKSGEPTNPLNYRPIALLSVLYKLFTKIINDRMMDVVECEHIISIAQGGFRREMSTVTQIHALRGIMEEANMKGKGIHITYIDIAGAYDSVPLERLYQTLEAYGFPPQTINLIRTMYTETKSASLQTMATRTQSQSHEGSDKGTHSHRCYSTYSLTQY